MDEGMDTGEAGLTLSRRAFVIRVGAAATLLGIGAPGQAQTGAATVPGKDQLIVRSPRPINLETPFTALTSEITPSELFFVRNNYDGPEIDPAQYVLRVDGEVENLLTLRLDDLRRMEQVTQTITLECPGTAAGSTVPRRRVSSGSGARSARQCGGACVWPMSSGWRSLVRRPGMWSRTGTMPHRRRRRPISSGATRSQRQWRRTRCSLWR
jgi:DMSO/TMAO reductase YedYZ molybdopterin-dependent catalytic subunit